MLLHLVHIHQAIMLPGAVAGNGLSGSAGAEGATFTVTPNAITADFQTLLHIEMVSWIDSVGLNAGLGNVIATGYFGRDANDYIAWPQTTLMQ